MADNKIIETTFDCNQKLGPMLAVLGNAIKANEAKSSGVFKPEALLHLKECKGLLETVSEICKGLLAQAKQESAELGKADSNSR